MKKYVCGVCGYVYDESLGAPESGVDPGTLFGDVPDTFTCPLCSMGKEVFNEE